MCSSGAGQPRKRGEQIGLVNDVADQLSGLDHARPPGEGRHADAAFKEVALAAPKDGLGHTESRRRVVRHRTVVGHGDDQGVLGDAEFLELVHHLADERIDVALQAVLQDAARRRAFLRVGDETRQVRPVGDVEGLAGLGIPLDEFQGAPLGLGVDLHVVFVASCRPTGGPCSPFLPSAICTQPLVTKVSSSL